MGLAAKYTPEELMAAVIAREVRDRETAAVGVNSPIPAAACLLAKESHAPHATLFIWGSQEHFPFPQSKEFFYLAQRGELDLFFLSGGQIDQAGNINLHVIGDYAAPRVRFPGGMGSAMLYFMAKRVILFRSEHSRRVLVPRVDFVTSPGSSAPCVQRLGGPEKLVTPLAVLNFNKREGCFELESVHPGVTLAQVQENTGFTLKAPQPVPVTPPPTPEELGLLRTAVREKLARIYPVFARQALMSPH